MTLYESQKIIVIINFIIFFHPFQSFIIIMVFFDFWFHHVYKSTLKALKSLRKKSCVWKLIANIECVRILKSLTVLLFFQIHSINFANTSSSNNPSRFFFLREPKGTLNVSAEIFTTLRYISIYEFFGPKI